MALIVDGKWNRERFEEIVMAAKDGMTMEEFNAKSSQPLEDEEIGAFRWVSEGKTQPPSHEDDDLSDVPFFLRNGIRRMKEQEKNNQ